MRATWYIPYSQGSKLIRRLRGVINELGEFNIGFKDILKDFFTTCLTCDWSAPVGDPLDIGYPDETNSLEMYEKIDDALWEYAIHNLHTFGTHTFEDGDDIDSAEEDAYEYYKASFDGEFDKVISDIFVRYEFSITEIYRSVYPTNKLEILDVLICDETITVIGDVMPWHRKL